MDDHETGSRAILVRKSWVKRRTGLEKVLLSILGVSCAAVMVTGVVVFTGRDPSVSKSDWTSRQQDVCTTADCALAAAEIIQAMDLTADPCDDFFRFSCGGWMDNNAMPEGRNKWGRFYELRGEVDNALKEIVESQETEGKPASVLKLRTMFDSCMDTDTMETDGIPQEALDNISETGEMGGWPAVVDNWAEDKFDMTQFIAKARIALNANYILSSWVYLDDLDTSKNVLYVDQPELGLPLSMYLDTESYAEYITAYKTFMFEVALVLVRELGSSVTDDQIHSQVEQAFAFETKIAKIMTPDSERRNSTAMYNPMMVSELKAEYSMIDWDQYFSILFGSTNVTVGDDEMIIVVQPDYFQQLQELAAEPVEIANYIYWSNWLSYAGDLTKEMRDIAWQYQSSTSGVATPAPRWQTCLSKAVGAFGFAAAHEYVIANFEESAKAEADMMVEDLRSAFKELVTETEWMDAETQVKAQQKADMMLQLIGYPDWLVDNDKVDEYFWDTNVEGPFFTKVMNMKGWAAKQDLITLREEPQRDIWLMHPAIVNAWYSPNHNTITFPAGILQPPFFKGGWPRYLNYGAIGMVIGHEITHGFDDQGRQYDGSGSASPWWSQETIEAFSVQAQCFIDQYGNYTVPELIPILGEEDAHLNGRNTQGENIADNGGIHETFRAYTRSVESLGSEPALPGLTQFTNQQMLFISYAQVWCEIQTPESLLGQVLSDPHSPGRFRVIGPLGNSEDFQKEFSCPADAAMNRPEKCQLW